VLLHHSLLQQASAAGPGASAPGGGQISQLLSIYRWIERGYVRVLDDQRGGGRGRKRLLNEADVAYAALVAKERGKREGRRILTPEFIPPHCVLEPA